MEDQMSQPATARYPIGTKLWRSGNHGHVWTVDALVPAQEGRPAFAVLVSEAGLSAEDVDLSHLEDPEQFTPVS